MSHLVRKPASARLLLSLVAAIGGAISPARAFSVVSEQDARAAQKQASAKPESSPAAPERPAEKHSTPEDRQRLVAIAHKLEAAPLDPALAPERQWAVNWAIAAPDIHVRICPTLLADLRRPRYKYKSEMGEQLLISSAAFLIEHPDQTGNNRAQSIGGMVGVVKAYSAIIKADPQATVKSFDALLEKQREGKLADAVGEMVKGCQ